LKERTGVKRMNKDKNTIKRYLKRSGYG